jgi:cytochrome c-type biogenesis protein CcmH/NrfG
MANVSKQTKRLVGEVAVLVCLMYVWGVSSPASRINSVKASVLKQVVKADPDNVDAYRFLAGYYIESGRYQDAADAQRQVVRMEPNDAQAWVMLGDIYSNCGHNEDAMAAYRKATNLYTDNAQAHYQLGEAYLRMGEKDLALEEHRKLKVLDEQLANDLLDLIHRQPQGPEKQ